MPLPELTRLCSFHCDDCFFPWGCLDYFCTPRKHCSNLAKLSKAVLGYPRVSKGIQSTEELGGWQWWQWLTCVFRLGIIANLLVSPLDPALLLLPNPSLSCLVVTQDVQIRESVLFPALTAKSRKVYCADTGARYLRIWQHVLLYCPSKENYTPLAHTPDPQLLFMNKILSCLRFGVLGVRSKCANLLWICVRVFVLHFCLLPIKHQV